MRRLGVTPHVAQDTARSSGTAIDGRTTRHEAAAHHHHHRLAVQGLAALLEVAHQVGGDPLDPLAQQQELRRSQLALSEQASALVRQAEAEYEGSLLEVEKAQAALALAEADFRRYEQLAETGATSMTQYDEKKANFDVARSNLEQAREAVAEQRSRAETARAQLEREMAANQAELGQLRRDLGKTDVTAPVSGIVHGVRLCNPQQIVQAGEELARIAPSGTELLVKVLVPSEDTDNIELCQRADLRLAGCPYPDFGTLRASVAPDATAPGGSGISSAPAADVSSAPLTGMGRASGYEVTLRPATTLLSAGERRCELRQGMNLSADITTREETALRFFLRKARLTSGV